MAQPPPDAWVAAAYAARGGIGRATPCPRGRHSPSPPPRQPPPPPSPLPRPCVCCFPRHRAYPPGAVSGTAAVRGAEHRGIVGRAPPPPVPLCPLSPRRVGGVGGRTASLLPCHTLLHRPGPWCSAVHGRGWVPPLSAWPTGGELAGYCARWSAGPTQRRDYAPPPLVLPPPSPLRPVPFLTGARAVAPPLTRPPPPSLRPLYRHAVAVTRATAATVARVA